MLSTETCVRKKPEAAPENRVGDFFSVSFSCVGQNQPQALEPHQAFSTTSTTTVSGVVYWLSKDPIGISGGLNLYAFCGNNPVNYIDPSGLCRRKVKDSLEKLKNSEWGKTREGRRVIRALEKANNAGKITEHDVVRGVEKAGGYYDGNGGVELKRQPNELIRRKSLAHEGTHLADDEDGIYDGMDKFTQERRAFDNADAVYNDEMGRDVHTSDDDIREMYGL